VPAPVLGRTGATPGSMPSVGRADRLRCMRGHFRPRRRAAGVALLLTASLVWPVVAAVPAATVAAGSIKAVFVDTMEPNGSHVLQTFTGSNATLHVTWDEDELIVSADTVAHQAYETITMGPRLGDPLPPGTYPAPAASPNAETPMLTRTTATLSGASCHAGSFTIHGISPIPQPGVATEISALSASFTQSCFGRDVRGTIRWNATLGFSAVGFESDPLPLHGLSVPQATTFAGNYSELTSITLQNHGTQALTFGTLALEGEAVDRWYIGVDECSGATVAPAGTCSLGLRAIEWIPNGYDDSLTLPVSTARGEITIRLPSFIQAASFVPIKPVRLLDTRAGIGMTSKLSNRAARTLTVVNRTPGDPTSNIPSNAVAVAGNFTITRQTSDGHAAMTTFLQNDPTTSTLNVPFGDTRANGTIVRLAGDVVGVTWVGSPGSKADAIFDATGYFVPTEQSAGVRRGNFRPASPYRVVNTRTGQGISSALRPNQPRTFTVPLVGVDANSTAVTGNLTVVRPTGAGHLTLAPTAAVTTTSTLNFPAGDTRANNVVAKLGGTVSNRTLTVTYVGPPGTIAHVVFDVTGTFGSGQIGYVPLVPNRIVDSRIGLGFSGRIAAGTAKDAPVENRVPSDPSKNLPPDSSTDPLLFKFGITGNATFVTPTRAGHLTVLGHWPESPPQTSTINSPAMDTRANGVIFGHCCGPTAAFWYEAPSGFTHVVFDVTGYFIH
jgi:hypothetical protein